MRTLNEWLAEYGLGHHEAVFAENRIDLDIIRSINEKDLVSIGIPLGDRRRFLRMLAAMPEELQQGFAAPPAEGAAVPEIRASTVLYADLVNSTELAETLEIEEYDRVLRVFVDGLTDIVADRGGVVQRVVGDGVAVCFGVPKATEDDALRAADAALAIVENTGRITVAGRNSASVRIGIATGLILLSEQAPSATSPRNLATGSTINLAARLQALALPGTVLIDQATERLVAGAFRTTFVGDVALRGFRGDRPVYSLERGVAGASHDDSPAATNMVGRELELELLAQRWRDASRAGSLVLLAGEAGIGKTRIVSEFVGRAVYGREQLLWIDCRETDQLRPMMPVIRALRQVVLPNGRRGRPGADVRLIRRWARARVGQEAAELIGHLLAADRTSNTPQGIAGTSLPAHGFGALARILEAATLARPLLVVVDDMHWLDPTTEEFLEELVRQIASVRVLLVCMARSGYTPSFLGSPRVSAVNLARLEDAHARALIEDVSHGAALPEWLKEEIVGRAEGVPLFLEELTKAVLETSDAIVTEDLAPEVAERRGPLPFTLLGSLLARLDRIDGAAKVAPAGAAIGRRFSRTMLLAVTRADPGESDAILERLVSAGLLGRQGTGTEARYAFRHSLVQEAAYETLPRSRKTALHERIYEVLDASVRDGHRVAPGVIGRHAQLAGQNEAACLWFRRAAAEVRLSITGAEAVAYLHAALKANECTPAGPERDAREIELREALYVPLQVNNWASDEIIANMQRLRELRMQAGEAAALLDVLHALAGYDVIAGRIAHGEALAAEMRCLYPADIVAIALADRIEGFCRFVAGDFDRALPLLDAAAEGARQAGRAAVARYYHPDTETVVAAMSHWARVLRGESDLSHSAATVERSAAACGDPWTQCYALTVLASAHQAAGEVEACLDVAEAALTIARECRSDYWIGWGTILRGWATARRGSIAGGIIELRAGIERYAKTKARQTLPYAKLLLADAYAAAGDLPEALELVQELCESRDPPEVHYIDRALDKLRRQLSTAAATSY